MLPLPYVCIVNHKQIKQMIITHQQIKYAKGGDVTKVGGTTKTNNVIRRAVQLRSIEEQMLNFAYKLGRAENQREERKNKR